MKPWRMWKFPGQDLPAPVTHMMLHLHTFSASGPLQGWQVRTLPRHYHLLWGPPVPPTPSVAQAPRVVTAHRATVG